MMMSDPRAMDDLLARAEAAVRRTTVPEGRPEEAFGRTCAACMQSRERARLFRPRSGTWSMARAVGRRRSAAMLCYLAAHWLAPPARAFAEVAQRLRDAQTLVYRTTTHIPGQGQPVDMRRDGQSSRADPLRDRAARHGHGAGHHAQTAFSCSIGNRGRRSSLSAQRTAISLHSTWPPGRSRGCGTGPRVEPVRGPPPYRKYRGRGLPSAAARTGHCRVDRPAHGFPSGSS